MTEPEERHHLGGLVITTLGYLKWADRHNNGSDARWFVEHISDEALADAIAFHDDVLERDGTALRYAADGPLFGMVQVELNRRAAVLSGA